MERKFNKQFPTRKLLDIVSSTRTWKIQHNAAVIIQRAWRKHREKMHPPPEKQKATQTVKTGITSSHPGGVGNMLNKMGNLLHIGGGGGSHDQKDRKGRRESIAMRDQPNRGSVSIYYFKRIANYGFSSLILCLCRMDSESEAHLSHALK